jgi:hypothetical protein
MAASRNDPIILTKLSFRPVFQGLENKTVLTAQKEGLDLKKIESFFPAYAEWKILIKRCEG